MGRMGAMPVFDNERRSAERISAILDNEGYVIRAIRDSAPPRTAYIAQPPALIVLAPARAGGRG